MPYEFITYWTKAGVATLTMNRPKEMNSLNLEIIAEMCAAVDEAAADEEVRVLVLTGAGNAFSAGDDIKIMGLAAKMTPDQIAETIDTQGYPALLRKLMTLPKPVIAAVNGVCYGAGGELALACDYTIAAQEAFFGQLYVNLGLMGNTWLLPRQVGVKKALELIWSGRIISAEEALGLGIADRVVPATELPEAVAQYAGRLAKGPTLAYGKAKLAVRQGMELGLDEGLKLMTALQAPLMKSADHAEGVKAFMEKRKPVYTGK